MIEIQCTSCHTRYRLDEQEISEEAPTFKCSRCGHVFSQTIAGIHNTDGPGSESREPKPVRQKSALGRKRNQGDSTPSDPASEENLKPDIDSAAATESHSNQEASAGINPPLPEEPAGEKQADVPTEPVPPEPLVASESSRSGEPTAQTAQPTGKEESPQPEAEPAFDFASEKEPLTSKDTDSVFSAAEDRNDGWEVGNPPSSSFESPRRTRLAGNSGTAERELFDDPADIQADNDSIDFENYGDISPSRRHSGETGKIHSAGFFVAIFLVVASGFLVVSMALCGAPMVSSRLLSQMPVVGTRFVAPATPATLVALTNLGVGFQEMKDGHRALVISGDAENVSTNSLNEVQVAVSLLDKSQHAIANESVFCGTSVSPTMVAQMTPHELEFLQRLGPPQKFVLKPSQSHPFVVVFVDPPRASSLFRISVSRADEGPAASAGT